MEEGAIAAAFKKVAAEELEKLYPLKALAEAHRLPVLPLLSGYQQTLVGIQSSASDDCVRILSETGAIFSATREKVRKLRESLNDKAIATLRDARMASEQVWQRLAAHSPPPEVVKCVDDLKVLLQSEQLFDPWGKLAEGTKCVLDTYKATYIALFDQRSKAYRKAVEEIKNRSEWEPLATTNKDVADSLLSPLLSRVGSEEDRTSVAGGTGLGRASLTEMQSDLAAV